LQSGEKRGKTNVEGSLQNPSKAKKKERGTGKTPTNGRKGTSCKVKLAKGRNPVSKERRGKVLLDEPFQNDPKINLQTTTKGDGEKEKPSLHEIGTCGKQSQSTNPADFFRSNRHTEKATTKRMEANPQMNINRP